MLPLRQSKSLTSWIWKWTMPWSSVIKDSSLLAVVFDKWNTGILIGSSGSFFASVVSVMWYIAVYIDILNIYVLLFYASHHSQVLLLQNAWSLESSFEMGEGGLFSNATGPCGSEHLVSFSKPWVNPALIHGQGPGWLDDCIYKRKSYPTQMRFLHLYQDLDPADPIKLRWAW